MRIAFVHYPGRLARLEDARAGRGPTEFLFGAVELERRGHEVSHYEVDPDAPSGPFARRLVDRQAGLERLPPHLSAAVLRGTRGLLPQLREVEVVVATTTGTAVALAVWRRAHRLRTPLVGIVAGLLNRPWGRARRATTLPLLRSMHAMLYGPGEAPGLLALDPGLAERVHLTRSAWTRGSAPRTQTGRARRAAIGLTATATATLLRAAPEIDAEVRILTMHPRPPSLPDNVRWEPADWHRRLLTDADVRSAFRSAAVVVVLGRKSRAFGSECHVAGVGVRAAGRPLADARPVGCRGAARRRERSPRPAGDPDAIGAAVSRVLADSASRPSLGRRLGDRRGDADVESYAERLLRICELARSRP